MALVPEASSGSTGVKDRIIGAFQKKENTSGQTDDKSSPGSEVKFRRNLFVNTLNPRAAERTAEKDRSKKLKEAVKPSEFVGFSEKTKEHFSTFLDGYLNDIAIEGSKPGGMDILNAQPHAAELFKLIGADKDDFDINTIPAKVGDILKHPEGWMKTKALIEQETALALAVAGMASAAEGTDRSNDPNDALKDMQTDPKTGKMRFRRTLGTISVAFMSATGGTAGAMAGEGAEYLHESGALRELGNFARDVAFNFGDQFARSPVATSAAIIGGTIGAVYGSRVMFGENGEDATPAEERLKVVGQALESVQNNEALRGYIKARLKIDVNDYEFSGGKINVIDNKSTGSIRDVMETARESFKVRGEYYDDLGIPKDARDIMPEQFLVSGKSPERHSERMHHDIMEKFHTLGGTDTGDPQDFEKFRKARELVMADVTEKLIAKMKGAEGPKDVSTIQTKIDERKSPDGRVRKEKGEKASKEKPLYAAAQETIENRLRTIDAVKKKEESLAETKDLLKEYLQEKFGPGETDAEAILERIKGPLVRGESQTFALDGGSPLEIRPRRTQEAEEDAKHFDNLTNIDKRHEGQTMDSVGNIVDPSDSSKIIKSRADIREEAQTLKAAETARHEAERRKIHEELSKISLLQAEIQQKLEEIKAKEKELAPDGVVAKERDASLSPQGADMLLTNKLLGALGNDLRTKSLTELMQQINSEHALNNTVGWPESENAFAEHKELLLYAIVEQRAQPEKGISVDMQDLRDLGITVEQINTLDEAGLQDVIGKLSGVPSALISSEIQDLKDEAESLLQDKDNPREQILKDVLRETQLAEVRLDHVINGVDLKEEIAQLEVTKDLMEKQGRILGMRRMYMSDVSQYIPMSKNAAGVDIVQNHSHLNADDAAKLTESEKARFAMDSKDATGADIKIYTPVAYFKLMDVMFDYKNRSDADSYFKKISDTLPPEKLFELLKSGAQDAQLDNVANTINLQILFSVLQDEIKKGLVTQPALRKIFTNVIDTVQFQAMALT